MAQLATRTVVLSHPADSDGWRCASRALLADEVKPECVVWQVVGEQSDLFADADPDPESDQVIGGHECARLTEHEREQSVAASGAGARNAKARSARDIAYVPATFIDLARCVACHRDPDRFGLLYRVLWRLAHGERDLLTRAVDHDVHRLHALAKAVARDRHKMHAFVRFRRLQSATSEHFVAWFEPEHHIVRLASDFFRRRFANMGWTILTPELSAHWDRHELVFGPGGGRELLPGDEPTEALWRTYFANTFNPARLRVDAMCAEMPVKYWKNLPESPLIANLIHRAGRRSSDMLMAAPTQPPRYATAAIATLAVETDEAVIADRQADDRDVSGESAGNCLWNAN